MLSLRFLSARLRREVSGGLFHNAACRGGGLYILLRSPVGRDALIPPQKPPLCKGRWHGASRDGGIALYRRAACFAPAVWRGRIACRMARSGSMGAKPLFCIQYGIIPYK